MSVEQTCWPVAVNVQGSLWYLEVVMICRCISDEKLELCCHSCGTLTVADRVDAENSAFQGDLCILQELHLCMCAADVEELRVGCMRRMCMHQRVTSGAGLHAASFTGGTFIN